MTHDIWIYIVPFPFTYRSAQSSVSMYLGVYLYLLAVSSMVSATTVTQIRQFLDQWVKDWSYPRVVEIANQVNYAGLAPDVVGRVDITNTFLGTELNTEYLFGMFADFGADKNTSLIGVPLNSTLSEIVIQGNVASVVHIATFNWTGQIIPVQFNVMWMFDDNAKVTQYDAQLVRSSWIFPTILPDLVPVLASELGEVPSADPQFLIAKRAALDICAAHERHCVGSLQEYNSTAHCMDFVMNQIPFGDIWQAGQNTGICRYLHKSMVSRRPSVHCPHIGPTGGDMCIARDYRTEVLNNPFPKPFIQIPPESDRTLEHTTAEGEVV